jgi:hypothetical protein
MLIRKDKVSEYAWYAVDLYICTKETLSRIKNFCRVSARFNYPSMVDSKRDFLSIRKYLIGKKMEKLSTRNIEVSYFVHDYDDSDDEDEENEDKQDKEEEKEYNKNGVISRKFESTPGTGKYKKIEIALDNEDVLFFSIAIDDQKRKIEVDDDWCILEI